MLGALDPGFDLARVQNSGASTRIKLGSSVLFPTQNGRLARCESAVSYPLRANGLTKRVSFFKGAYVVRYFSGLSS